MKENPNNEASARYVLLEAERLETLVRTNYLLSKSLLAFEHLCSHSAVSYTHLTLPTT